MTSAVPIIRLIPLDDAERAAFIAAELADDVELRMATSDVTEADARQTAHAELLPVLEREHREVVHLTDRQCTALNAEGHSVGWLWVRFPASPVNSAYLYQITVPAEHRRKSYGFAMLQALDVLL